MIRPLRRRHQWLVRGLFVLIVGAAALALTHRAPDARVDHLPSEIVGSAAATR